MKRKELFANIFISHSMINKHITLHRNWKHIRLAYFDKNVDLLLYRDNIDII